MINCDVCGNDIGNELEPIFVESDEETIVCRSCYTKDEGHPPNEMDGEIDADDDVSQN